MKPILPITRQSFLIIVTRIVCLQTFLLRCGSELPPLRCGCAPNYTAIAPGERSLPYTLKEYNHNCCVGKSATKGGTHMFASLGMGSHSLAGQL